MTVLGRFGNRPRRGGPRGRGRAGRPRQPCSATVEIAPRERALRTAQLTGWPVEHHRAARGTGLRTEVEYEIRRFDELRVVFHDNEGIPRVAQAMEYLNEPADVARVQPDTRLVEYEQGIHQRRPEGGCQVDALYLAAAESARLTVEGQIAEADVEQVSEPGGNLLEEQLDRLVEGTREIEVPEEGDGTGNGKKHDLVDIALLTAAREAPQKRLRLEACAAAVGAGRVGPVLGKQHPDVHLVALRLKPVEESPYAVPLPVFPRALPVYDPCLLLVGKLAPGNIGSHAARAREMQHFGSADAVALALPGAHRSVGEGHALVGDDEVIVYADDPAESAAGFAGAHRRVEREGVRRRLAVMNIAARAVEVGGVVPGFPRGEIGAEDVDRDPTLAVTERRLEVFAEALTIGRRVASAILYDLDPLRGLSADVRVSLLGEKLDNLRGIEAGRNRYGKGDHESTIRRDPVVETVEDTLGRISPHLPPAGSAVQSRRPRKEQFQVIIELGHGADGGAGGPNRIRLVDGDRRRNPLDPVDLRLVHAIEKLPGVGGEGLHVAPLAFRVHRVENKRRLAGAADPRNHDQPVQRKLDAQVLEIVLTRAFDAYGGPVCVTRVHILSHVELRA